MRFDLITIFPEFFTGPLDYGIVRRAREARLIETQIHDLRNFTHDRHRTVDDRPFGGGEGMVMKCEPLFDAVESLVGPVSNVNPSARTAIVLLSAAGKLFRQETARRFAQLDQIILISGRYEGVDERVAEHLATDEISIGDFVLSGGELAAALILDAVTRLIPGALGNEDSTVNESFSASTGEPSNIREAITSHESLVTSHGRHGILDYPHYTRPPSYRGWDVPEVLLGGNHEEIRRWRHQQALEKTKSNRPDLLVRDHSNRP
ncbi:MAG: tRNA (guanosine(37)-N1)-methyltransferase TrmD [Candidatus Acidiferrales bacterium]